MLLLLAIEKELDVGVKLREEFILSELAIATLRCSKSNKLLKRELCAIVGEHEAIHIIFWKEF
jgi:hypothetical protein